MSAKRLPELDGVRGIAVLMVLAVHYFTYSMLDRTWTGFPRLVMDGAVAGWLGVDLFFCLSGFLITGILLDSRSDPRYFRNFYARRALRILPLYLLVLAILAVFYRDSGRFVLIGLLMSPNLASLVGATSTTGGTALWSLGVEEHFYLIWPWVTRYLRPATLGVVCVAICVLEPLIRAIFRTPMRDVYFYSWFRFDALAWGALIAIFVRWNGANRARALRLAGGLLAVAVSIFAIGAPLGLLHRVNRIGAALQFTPFEMAFASGVLTLVSLSGSRATAFFRQRPLTLWGDLSYCVYVTHLIVADAADWVYSRFADLYAAKGHFSFIVARAVICTALCCAIALASRRFFELPILRLKRHFTHS